MCFSYRLLQARYGGHVEASDDRHQRIKVANVKTFSSSLNPIFDDTNALLLLCMLKKHGEIFAYKISGTFIILLRNLNIFI